MRASFLLTSSIVGLAFTAAACGSSSKSSANGGAGGNSNTGGSAAAGASASGGNGTAGTSAGGNGAGGAPGCPSETLPALSTQVAVSGFDRPVYFTQAPGDDARSYVVEQVGRIQVVKNGAVSGVFMNLMSTIQCGDETTCLNNANERGLLGLAFHPNYVQNGRFFVYYANINTPFRNTLLEFKRSASNPEQGDPTPVATIFDQADPETNHNGGQLTFGPDGMLYLSVGDGGGACDRHGTIGNAQDPNAPFGKIHRFDVDNAANGYAAAGNPFAAGGGLKTVWAYGLRNPWRFSFDRVTHDLWIGDVGQDSYEEIDFAPSTSKGGENYGWRVLEGNCSSTASGCTSNQNGCLTDPQIKALGFVPPVLTAPQASGPNDVLTNPSAITGGVVYRGSAIPGLRGWYLFGDSYSDSRAAIRMCNGVFTPVRVPDIELAAPSLVSFAEDNANEVYMVSQGNGSIVKIVPK